MTIKYTLLFLSFAYVGCVTTQRFEKNFFKVKTASYQSYMKNENEKGTNVSIEISELKDGVEFDSIVFRELRNTIAAEKKGSSIILKSFYEYGIQKLEKKYTVDNRPDMLIFRANNIKYCVPIKNWKRKRLKY